MHDAKNEKKEKDPLKYSCIVEKGYFKGLKCESCISSSKTSDIVHSSIKIT